MTSFRRCRRQGRARVVSDRAQLFDGLDRAPVLPFGAVWLAVDPPAKFDCANAGTEAGASAY